MEIGHARSLKWLTAVHASLHPFHNGRRLSMTTYGRCFSPNATTASLRLRGRTLDPVQHIRRCYGSRPRVIPRVTVGDRTGGISKAAEPASSLTLPRKCSEPSFSSRRRLFSDDVGQDDPPGNRTSGTASEHAVDRHSKSLSKDNHLAESQSTRINHHLSAESIRKLGSCREFFFEVPKVANNSGQLALSLNEIQELFTSCVEASTRKGLSCWAEALTQCSKVTGPVEHVLICPRHPIPPVEKSDAGSRRLQRTYIRGFVGDDMRGLTLSLPHMFTIHSSVINTAVGPSSLRLFRVVLTGRLDPSRLENDNTVRDLDTSDEAAFLADMALTVSRRVCNAMSFQTAQDALSSIAETMLRVLEFRSRAIILQRVCLFSSMSTEVVYTSDADCYTIAQWKAHVPLEAEDESQNDVEIIFGDGKAYEHCHTNDQEDYDQGRDDNGDKSNIAVDLAFNKHQSSIAVAEASSNQGNDSALRSDDDSATGHTDVFREPALTPGSFGPREKPYLTVPLHQTPLASEKRGKKSCFCGPIRSERIENHLGFRSFRFRLHWKTKQWGTVAETSILDLAQTIEDHLVSTTENSLTSLGDATKALGTMLPENPEVCIELTSQTTHCQHGQEGCFRIKYLSDGTVQISLPLVPITDLNTSLLVGVSLAGTLVAMDGRDSPALSALQAINASLEPVFGATLKDTNTEGLQDAARLIAIRTLRDSKLSAGLMDLQKVSSRIVESIDGRKQSAVQANVSREHVGAAVFIAFGSNVGDRVSTIEDALRVLHGNDKIKLLQTSPLYETEPMYVEDQERFLNGVCQIKTQLDPIELLDTLQAVETDLGRVKLVDKGPRNIDLDIIAYGQQVIESDRLIVPHRLMLEREFVLRPLCDLDKSFIHPQTMTTAMKHLKQLPPSITPIYPLTPLAPGVSLRSRDPLRKTLVMSVLNVTPDSFSDGGLHQPADMVALKRTAAAHIAAGAKIIDIGGQSSRPNAPDVTAEEEIARILPAIEAIKSLPEAAHVAISIDTYRAAVAEAAFHAGAHIINDISAGMLDPDMLPTIARLGCTYVMMHMRGTPATMQNEDSTSYPGGLIRTIGLELKERVEAAGEAGIRHWRIILDPGIGFAKTTEQNLEILRRFRPLRRASGLEKYPWLVGSSRKGFIGQITGVENAADRLDGTAATVTAAVQGGAEIVRVHDVEEMARVVKMANAIYRQART